MKYATKAFEPKINSFSNVHALHRRSTPQPLGRRPSAGSPSLSPPNSFTVLFQTFRSVLVPNEAVIVSKPLGSQMPSAPSF